MDKKQIIKGVKAMEIKALMEIQSLSEKAQLYRVLKIKLFKEAMNLSKNQRFEAYHSYINLFEETGLIEEYFCYKHTSEFQQNNPPKKEHKK